MDIVWYIKYLADLMARRSRMQVDEWIWFSKIDGGITSLELVEELQEYFGDLFEFTVDTSDHIENKLQWKRKGA